MDRPQTVDAAPGTPKLKLIRGQHPDRGGNAMLLTGATGFVGGQLLLRLLTRDHRPLVCLVRAENPAAAEARGADRLRALLGRDPTESESARVRWIQSDLEAPQAGLDRSDWDTLAASISEIFHCAASVEFNLPLEQAERINVDGVRTLLGLARAAGPGFDRFHHVSTAYVSGRTNARVDAHFLPEDKARHFRNTYERTKARAERLLREQPDVAVSIYRPSIIAGDTRTGRTDNWNVLYVPMRQMVKGRLPFLCHGGKAIADTIGVDFVVDGIVALSARSELRIQAYHLTADRLAFDVGRYVRRCNRAAAQICSGSKGTALIGAWSWALRTRALRGLAYAPRFLGGLRKKGETIRQGLRSFEPYLAYTRVDVEFEAGWEHHYLAAHGIRMPDPDVYLDRLLDYALASDFGRTERATPVWPRPAEIHEPARPAEAEDAAVKTAVIR